MSESHLLCALEDIEDGGVRKFEVAGRELAVVRIGEDQPSLVAGVHPRAEAGAGPSLDSSSSGWRLSSRLQPSACRS